MSVAREPEVPSWSDVLDLVTRLDASAYAEVELDMPGLRLRMSSSPTAFNAASQPAVATPERAVDEQSADGESADVAPPALDESALAGEALAEVVAPMLGTFYSRPSPDAPPFVQVGASVTAETTVAIIEVMKLMNPVAAGVAGRVVEVRVDDGDLVEHGQVLLRVAPEPEPRAAP